MNKINETTNDPVWEMIGKEKKKDNKLKIVSRVAWGTTLLVLMVFLLFTVMDFTKQIDLYHKGIVPYEGVLKTFVPFLIILGSLSLIIAIISTVGTFLRLRTTSLLEIQQRLSNLEEMITSEKS